MGPASPRQLARAVLVACCLFLEAPRAAFVRPWREPPPRHLAGCRALSPGEAAAAFAKQGQSLQRPSRQITQQDVDFFYSKSGGPGGQNVNKVETKVEARFNVRAASFLPDWVKDGLLKKQANRVNRQGILTVASEELRTQQGNQKLVMQKLQEMIEDASFVPPPPSKEKVAKIQQSHAAADRKRLEDKRFKARKKEERRRNDDW